jgi:hypothetical protein
MTSVTTETPVAEIPTTRPSLTLADRCDRCGAQAFMRAVFPDGAELLFCGHHGREFSAVLATKGVELEDFTDLLYEMPSSS